jgi:cysteine-rich repeat protein
VDEKVLKSSTRGPAIDTVVGTRCGNGQLDPGEECDDGNANDGDLCAARSRCPRLQVNQAPRAGAPRSSDKVVIVVSAGCVAELT